MKQPRPHQQDAISAGLIHFAEQDRGLLVMACGTGKTLTALWLCEQMHTRRILVAIPSLQLQSQSLVSWLTEIRSFGWKALLIGSDKSVGAAYHVQVTTDADEISQFLLENPLTIVFCTYQSVTGLSDACKRTATIFDVAILDEAHRTAGPDGKPFGRLLSKGWDKHTPPPAYYSELFRVSKNQIIWGANHFISRMPFDSPCWIVWDKKNSGKDFADCELAWCSMDRAVRKFEWLWDGFRKQEPESRIHPTQKPVALYNWLLDNYAKPGDKILDTHLGSQSSRIAAYKKGFDFWGYEIDADYFVEGNARFEKAISLPLFDAPFVSRNPATQLSLV